VRILIVSHPALDRESGAAQIALNLAAALGERGHDAVAWSPEPLPPDTRWWNVYQRQRRAIERFAAAAGPWDVIESPAVSATRRLARLARPGLLVVRDVQPELLYLRDALKRELRLRSPRTLFHTLGGTLLAAALVGGWRRARLVLCLGSREREWMAAAFPRWEGKLRTYVTAPADAEKGALAEVRRRRAPTPPEGEGVRFLWIGRWTPHKGTAALLALIAARAGSNDRFTLAGCGEGAERELPAEWLRSGRVRMIPTFRRAELPDLLSRHDAGLFTSEVEGWGLCLNEMLESGLPVFATEAGGVDDLRPYFPHALRPFPPAERSALPLPLEDLEANGYQARFHWRAIARAYEEAVLAALATLSGRRPG
jgi:glycosyltransferase involved in cell wall biosynthesis